MNARSKLRVALPKGAIFEDALRALKEAGYEASGVVRFGDPAPEIVGYAEQEQVQVIAMATHGRTGIGRLALGSVAEQVLRSARIPVLMVHPS